MKLIKNLLCLLFHNFIFCVILTLIYLFELLDFDNKHLSFLTLYSFLRDYFFIVFVISSIISFIYIGALNKFDGFISPFLSIVIFSFFISVYYINRTDTYNNIKYLKSNLDSKALNSIDLSNNIFTKFNNYSLMANSRIENNLYKDVIVVYNNVYFADFISFDDSDILMSNVSYIEEGTNVKYKNTISLNKKSLYDYFYTTSRDILFGFNIVPVLSYVFRYDIDTNISFFLFMIIYFKFFLLFLALYMLSWSLSSNIYKYHNFLVAFLIYCFLQVLSKIIVSKYHLLSLVDMESKFWSITIILYLVSLFVLIFSLIIKNLFKMSNNIYEEDIDVIDNDKS